MRKKNVKNKLLIIIACFCIVLLGVGVAGAITQGFTNANPYGWFKSATADSNKNKTNPEKEQEHNVDPVPVLKYGLDIHDGDEITGIGYRMNFTPSFNNLDWETVPEEMEQIASLFSLPEGSSLSFILSVFNEADRCYTAYAVCKVPFDSDFFEGVSDYIYPEYDYHGERYCYVIYWFWGGFFPFPIYSSCFNSNSTFNEDPYRSLRFSDDGWLDFSSMANMPVYSNGFLPFGAYGIEETDGYEDIYCTVHVYEANAVQQIFYTLDPEDYFDYYSNLVNSNSNDEPIENNSIQLSPFISNETHLEIGDHIYFDTSKGSELASYISNLEYDDSGAYILFTTDRMNLFISAMDLSKFGATGYALLFNNGQDNTKIIYATASGELNGMSWNSGWNNLDSNNGMEITYGSSGHTIGTINDTDPATWNGIIIGLLAQE